MAQPNRERSALHCQMDDQRQEEGPDQQEGGRLRQHRRAHAQPKPGELSDRWIPCPQQTQAEIDRCRNQSRRQRLVSHIVREVKLHRQKSGQAQADQLRSQSAREKEPHAQKDQGELRDPEDQREEAENEDCRRGVS